MSSPIPSIPVASGRLPLSDTVYEAASSLASRPMRTLLTSLGVAVGVGTLVATVGISLTAGNQIADTLGASRPTTLRVVAPEADDAVPVALPWSVEARLGGLAGVVAAGAIATLAPSDGLVSSAALPARAISDEMSIATFAASPGVAEALGFGLLAGRSIDAGDVAESRDVALVGASAARRLGISRPEIRPAVFIGDQMFTVVGIIGSTSDPTFLDAVVVPYSTAERRFGPTSPSEVVVMTEAGATNTVALQAPVALAPTAPGSMLVQRPPDPSDLHRAIEGDVNGLYLALGGLTMLAGAIAVANSMLTSVMERTAELGLRRALGATRRNIAGQLMIESGIVGAGGALLGATAGVLTVVVVAMGKQWTPVLTPSAPLMAAVLGVLTALVASIFPARRAAQLVPVDALRS